MCHKPSIAQIASFCSRHQVAARVGSVHLWLLFHFLFFALSSCGRLLPGDFTSVLLLRPRAVNERYRDVLTATLGLGLAVAFYQKHMEVRSHRLGVKLPHHQGDLTSMVSGVVRYMLHEVRQSHLRRAKGKRSC